MTARCALLPTICLVGGDRALRFMDERVPGISVPAATIERIATSAEPGEETYRLAVEQARHALSLPGVAGIHLASFRRDDAVARLCAELGIGREARVLVCVVSLRARFREGLPVITSELVPPRGADAAGVRAQVEALAFADALNVTDLPQARTRMSALAASALVLQAGGRPILQMTTRDRNRLALAADAIGAAALGVEAILPLFGDPVPEGVQAAEVRDVDSAGLVALLADLAEGRTPDGLELDTPATFLIGAAATPGRTSVENLAGKIDAGAAFVQTQIVLDAHAFEAWLEPIREAGLTDRVAILPGVVIPRSAAMVDRMAGFGAQVAEGVAERAERGDGLAFACELAEHLLTLPGVAGLHLMPLGASPDAMAELAEHARRARTPS